MNLGGDQAMAEAEQPEPAHKPTTLTGALVWSSLSTPNEIGSMVAIAPLNVSWPIHPDHYGKTVFPNSLIARVNNQSISTFNLAYKAMILS